MNTPHQMARMSDPTPRGYPTPRPQQRPASNSEARKRHTAENDAAETYTRQDVAAAWDEGWDARSDAESRGPSVIPPNPYGPSGKSVIPPASVTS